MAKYHNEPCVIEGIHFPSIREGQRYQELRLMERGGWITDLKRQVRFLLIPTQKGPDGKLLERPVYYVADFTYNEKQFDKVVFVVEDSKGMKTKDYIIKRKLMLQVHGIRIREV